MRNLSKWISIVLIATFTLSTLAYSLLQGSRFKTERSQVTLPSSTILNSPLSSQQELLAIQKGYTIIYLNYSENYTDLKNFLESFAYKQKSQIFLIEQRSDKTEVDIKSMKGEDRLENPSVNETENALCYYLLNPPIECVLRQV